MAGSKEFHVKGKAFTIEDLRKTSYLPTAATEETSGSGWFPMKNQESSALKTFAKEFYGTSDAVKRFRHEYESKIVFDELRQSPEETTVTISKLMESLKAAQEKTLAQEAVIDALNDRIKTLEAFLKLEKEPRVIAHADDAKQGSWS